MTDEKTIEIEFTYDKSSFGAKIINKRDVVIIILNTYGINKSAKAVSQYFDTYESAIIFILVNTIIHEVFHVLFMKLFMEKELDIDYEFEEALSSALALFSSCKAETIDESLLMLLAPQIGESYFYKIVKKLLRNTEDFLRIID